MLETVCAEEGTAEVSGDYDEYVVDILGEDQNPNIGTSCEILYQDLEKVRQSTACGGLPIIIVVYESRIEDQDERSDDKVRPTLMKNVLYLTAPGVDDRMGRSSNFPVG